MGMAIQKTNRITSIQSSFSRGLEKSVKDTLNSIAEDAKNRVPIETGQLHDSISVKSNRFLGEVVVDSDHALWVEMGTEHQAAQPFLSPAIEANRETLTAKIKEAMLK